MKIEVRADGLHINGYVNVTGKLSRPVITPRGKVLETIEERAFDEAIKKSGDISVQLDHDAGHAYARTSDGTLKLREDAIGLHAEVLITDETVIDMARKGKIRGWSFGMYNVLDEMESRGEGELPIRHVKGLLMDHISLIKDKIPCYAATSVEVRAEGDVDIEQRAIDTEPELTIENRPDYSQFEATNDLIVGSINSAEDARLYREGQYDLGIRHHYATGGHLGVGQSGIIAEAGPELLEVMNGGVRITPLTRNAQNTPVQTAAGGAGNTTKIINNTVTAVIKSGYDVYKLAEDMSTAERLLDNAKGV